MRGTDLNEIYKRIRAIFNREWRTVLLVGILGGLFSAILNFFFRGVPIYQATQLIVISPEKTEILVVLTLQQPAQKSAETDIILAKIKFPSFYKGFWDTSLSYEVLKGKISGIKRFKPGKYNEKTGKDIVLCPCSRDYELIIYDSVSLQRRLARIEAKKIENKSNPSSMADFVEISYVSPDKRWAQKASELISQWIAKKQVEVKKEKLLNQKEAILRLMETYKRQIDLYAEELKNIKKTLKYPEYGEEDIRKFLVEITNQRNALINLSRKISDGKMDTFVILTGDPNIDELQRERVKVISEYISLRSFLGDSHPEVKMLKERLKRIDDLTKKRLEERIAFLNGREKFFRDILPVVIEERASLLTTQRNLENAEDLYILLGQNLNDVEVKLSSTSPGIEIVGEPKVSLYNKYSKMRNVILLGFLAGIILGILFAVFRDLTTDYVLEESYLPFNREMIFSLPRFSEGEVLPIRMILDGFYDPDSSALNEFRKLAFKLGAFENLKEMLVITGTKSGEGKTFISANLSATLTISGVKTLLVDGDVRARGLTEYLGFKDKSGYADGNFEPYRLSENLYFLPIGKAETDIFVAFKNLVEALNHLAGNYLVVIDMAPVGVSPEIRLLEKLAVKFVLVTRYNYTLRDALESIEIEPSLVIFNFSGSRARYYYYSKYYSKYYKPKKRGFWRFLKK
jgi:uncharacterized protein involved in exopolysaccharide biosynthesis